MQQQLKGGSRDVPVLYRRSAGDWGPCACRAHAWYTRHKKKKRKRKKYDQKKHAHVALSGVGLMDGLQHRLLTQHLHVSQGHQSWRTHICWSPTHTHAHTLLLLLLLLNVVLCFLPAAVTFTRWPPAHNRGLWTPKQAHVCISTRTLAFSGTKMPQDCLEGGNGGVFCLFVFLVFYFVYLNVGSHVA